MRLHEPWTTSKFNLDSLGVAGFFGGEEAISAMTTVHLYRGRRWLGWYNSPGGYTVAKHYGRLARSSLWTGLYPGTKLDPVELFELGGKKSPRFIGAHSGTILPETGHLGYLLMKECETLPPNGEVEKRKTTPSGVTVVNLEEPFGINDPTADTENDSPPLIYPTRLSGLLISIIPIGTSLIACVFCALLRDWFGFAMILLGIVANGLTCLVLGSGTLFVKRVKPASDVPKGDGLLESKKELVVLLGPESAIAQVTRASFGLKFKFGSAPNYHNVGRCCILQTGQFLIQLLLIPQAGLFGQSMFLTTFAVSWLYNAYLSSFDKEEMQRKVLLKPNVLNIDGKRQRYVFGTRTAMAVFVMFALQPSNPRSLLDHLIPNNTNIWNTFKDQLAKQAPIGPEVKELSIDFSALKTVGNKGLMDDLRMMRRRHIKHIANIVSSGRTKRKKCERERKRLFEWIQNVPRWDYTHISSYISLRTLQSYTSYYLISSV
ncbi:hypothetical protein K435DRAFT_722369 [Dendrothele bispora CBS 962.96]|uniref:Uncharacterized protein n=1 Tax=Dendrothele bispora (strain CBS 962.96) TaxID=1314807 RepID=A0A4S8M4B2_DENBC|nr:hypothetical protein K435DRAFT_722369 [Dendrothele bispora CBS 962.96]